jgi:hypothetical protein
MTLPVGIVRLKLLALLLASSLPFPTKLVPEFIGETDPERVGAAIGVSLLVPTLAVGLYLFVALSLGLPARTLRRLLHLSSRASGESAPSRAFWSLTKYDDRHRPERDVVEGNWAPPPVEKAV